ncbi:MAG: acetyl-CoA C-acyltransferase [Spongiibacteraceae bacterium]
MSKETLIVGAARTPIAALSGELSSQSSTDLGAVAIAGALERSGLNKDVVQRVFMGNVLTAGLGQAPARTAAMNAGIDLSAACVTLNKMCGSGMEAVMLADTLIRAGDIEVAIAGGMESMTNAPYLVPKARGGYRIGHDRLLDHMMFDGLEDPASGDSMGICTEEVLDKNVWCDRAALDKFAVQSLEWSQRAQRDGDFKDEIVPVALNVRGKTSVVDSDEQPRRGNAEKIPTLKPAFRRDGGRLTAANSSSISDGAAALVLMDSDTAKAKGIKGLARIVAQTHWAGAPREFACAPNFALDLLFKKTGWSVADVDLFEINEAFAAVPMMAMHAHDIPREKINVNGGACALGHPIGASGARILVTLLYALKRRNLKRGIAGICIAGGEATAVAIELI